jgi:oxygen-independent coproporphyrinogen-3 oxidase
MPFGLYIHFPFCQNRCSYCNYDKVPYDRTLEERFFEALTIETRLATKKINSPTQTISTIFLGGGTPSLASNKLLFAWLEVLNNCFSLSATIEFSIECNPETVTRDRLDLFKELGINRPTFGIQSFDTNLLQLLDRRHNADHSREAIYHANILGFDSFGCDLIFGLPGQNTTQLNSDLDQLIDLDPPHISYYQLTVEDDTPLAARVADGRLQMPDSDRMYALYRIVCERLAEAGYNRYEVSSFAKPGFECRHNLGYWRGDDYLGLGPSAHSLIDGKRFSNNANVHHYIESLRNDKRPIVEESSGAKQRMTETIMVGLHIAEGVNRARFVARFGCIPESRVNSEQVKQLSESGHLISDNTSLRLTETGLYLADEITARLLK